MKSLFIFLVLMTSVLAVGQTQNKWNKAETYYSKLAYAKAIPLYEDLLGSQQDGSALKSRIAMCYYYTGNMQKSEFYFRQMILASNAMADDYYFFAQVLKQNGNYSESDEWMSKFLSKNNSDSRAKLFAQNKDYLKQIQKQEPFFSIKDLKINTEYSDFGGYPIPGADQVYILSNRTSGSVVRRKWAWSMKPFLQLFTTVSDENHELDHPKQVSEINKKYHEGPICFSPDGKVVYFTRNNISRKVKKGGIRNLKIYRCDIAPNGDWKNETILPFCSDEYSVGHPSLSFDGTTLFFASDMPGGMGGSDIYKVSVSGNNYGQPQNLGNKINTEGQEMFPWISTDGSLFFSSDGLIGLGGLDIYVTLPDDKNFQNPINVGEPVNSANDDFAFISVNAGKTGYFSSNRASGKGEDDIYAYTQLREITRGKHVRGKTLDEDGVPVANADVKILDENGSIIANTVSDDRGNYDLLIDDYGSLTLLGQKDHYFDDRESLASINHLEPEANIDLVLMKDPGLSLEAFVTDKKTSAPLNEVKVTIIDNFTGKDTILVTSNNGSTLLPLMDKKLNERGSYNIIVEKDGYFTKTMTYNTLFDKPGIYNVSSSIDLSMDPIVKDLREMVQIESIKFDYNKFNIRPDAAIELDKIVEIMNKYPNMIIELGAHTDCRGTVKANQILSDKRAKSSAEYIKKRISNPERIYGKGYGESQLINDCACEGQVKSTCTEEEHAKNRRTEFKVINTGNDKVIVNGR